MGLVALQQHVGSSPIRGWICVPCTGSVCALSRFSHVWLYVTLWTIASPPGSSVHGILQARTLLWIAIPFFRGSSWPRDQTRLPCIGKWILKHWTTREALQPECESRLCLFLALSDLSLDVFICKMGMMILPLVGLLWGLNERTYITRQALSVWDLPPVSRCHSRHQGGHLHLWLCPPPGPLPPHCGSHCYCRC